MAVLLFVSAGLVTGFGLVFIVGGYSTRAAGRWQDDGNIVVLRQRGPWLTGYSKMTESQGDGEHFFRGLCCFGAIFLRRTSRGRNHLLRLGFASSALPLMRGRANASFHFRLRDNGGVLAGKFIGKHFRFNSEQTRILDISDAPAKKRTWLRQRVEKTAGG